MEYPEALLLVEGQDDEFVVDRLFRHHGVAEFDIQDRKGCDRLLKELPVILKGSAKRHLGIVLDADTDLLQRWQQTRSILLKAGYRTVPDTPTPGGTVISEVGRPNIGVWLMPDNSAQGMIEDFVTGLIPENDPCWPIAVEAIDNLQGPNRRFRDVDTPKARIHTWLAWQETPGARMGLAIAKKFLDPDRASATAFVAWARRITAGPANS